MGRVTAYVGDTVPGTRRQTEIANLMTGVALFDPHAVVVGGGLAEAGDALLVPLREAMHRRVSFHREPALFRAALGDEAGSLGAALLALDSLHTRGGTS